MSLSITATPNAVVMAKQPQQETTHLVPWLKGAPLFYISSQCTLLDPCQNGAGWKISKARSCEDLKQETCIVNSSSKPPIQCLCWPHGELVLLAFSASLMLQNNLVNKLGLFHQKICSCCAVRPTGND